MKPDHPSRFAGATFAITSMLFFSSPIAEPVFEIVIDQRDSVVETADDVLAPMPVYPGKHEIDPAMERPPENPDMDAGIVRTAPALDIGAMKKPVIVISE